MTTKPPAPELVTVVTSAEVAAADFRDRVRAALDHRRSAPARLAAQRLQQSKGRS